MKVSIFGSGKIVQIIAKDLVTENNQVQIFYKEESFNKKLYNIEGVRLFAYSSFEDLYGHFSNLSKEDSLLILEDRDEDNFLLARILSSLPMDIHLLVHNPKKAKFIQENREIFSQTCVYCPSLILGQLIQKFYYEDKGLLTEAFDEFHLSLLRYPVEDQREFVDRRVKNIGAFEDLVLVGVKRDREVLVPDGNTTLKTNDKLHLIGSIQAIRRFKRHHHIYREKLPEEKRKFVIFGTDKNSLSIGHALMEKGGDITFMGKKEIPTKEWSEIFPQAVYRGLGSKGYIEALEDVNIGECDGFISSSPSDGDNVMALMAAYSLGMKATTLFIQDEAMLTALDTEKVSAIYTINNRLAHYIKRSLTGPKDISLHLLPGTMEIFEILIKENIEVVGKRIEDLELPKGFLIGGIIRAGQNSVIPKGYTRILEGDRLLIFMIPEVAYAIRKFLNLEPEKNLITELLGFY